MSRTTKILLLVFSTVFIVSLYAQEAKKNTDNKSGHKPKLIVYPVYLGRSNYQSGPISKRTFDSLMKQGLTSRDSLGNKYRVSEFAFNYAERNLYEDSSGENMMWLTDYLLEYCIGDTLSSSISSNLYERTKAGDTIYIDHIALAKMPVADSTQIFGKAMKFEITK